jgi:type IV pilus assembly protein PilN
MYSLDINFLKDRSDQPVEGSPAGRPSPSGGPAAFLPAIIGLIVGLALPGLCFAGKIILENRGQQLTVNKEQLTTELTNLQAQLQQAKDLQAQADQVEQDIQALIGVFGKVQPISAIIQEVSNRMPSGLQLNKFESSPDTITFAGTATSYTQLNDCLLVLKQSPFLDPKAIKLDTSEVKGTESVFKITQPEGIDPVYLPTIKVNLPYVVGYTISAKLSNPSTLDPKILNQLKALGATGLVARLETLQQEGVIQP